MMTSSRLQRISLFEGLSEVQLLRLEELCVEEKFAKTNIFSARVSLLIGCTSSLRVG